MSFKKQANYLVLLLILASFFVVMTFSGGLNKVEDLQNIVLDIDGEDVEYKEPRSVMFPLLVYPIYKITGNMTLAFTIVQFILGALVLWILLDMLGFKLSLLYFAYAPAMMSFYEHYTALSVLTIIGCLYFYMRKKYLWCGLMFIPMIANKPETAFIPVLMFMHSWWKTKKFISRQNMIFVLCAIAGVLLYVGTNAAIFGDPLVNLKYNQYGPGYNDMFTVENLNPTTEFPSYATPIRIAIIFIVVITSLILLYRALLGEKYMLLLFGVNTCFILIYGYFSITGFWWMFFIFQRYFSFLLPLTLLSLKGSWGSPRE